MIPPQLQVGEFVISVASSCDGNVACAGGRVQAWGEDGKSYEAADVAAHVLHSLATVLPSAFDVLALAIEMGGSDGIGWRDTDEEMQRLREELTQAAERYTQADHERRRRQREIEGGGYGEDDL